MRWACQYNFSDRDETAQFWYVSEEKLEPRLGRRYEESGSELELPLDIARQIARLNARLAESAGEESVAAFLMRFPECRDTVRRVQLAGRHPYAEIRDNLVGNDSLPIDMLRCKLSFFGASKFDPKSELWTRITLFQGAPLIDDEPERLLDDWWLPVLEAD